MAGFIVSLLFITVFGFGFFGFRVSIQVVQEAVHLLLDLDGDVVVESDVVLGLDGRASRRHKNREDERESYHLQHDKET